MAFCPECGKSTTAEATRCIHCGHELESKAAAVAKAGGARFKGTMMMAAPAVAKPAAAAPVPAAQPAPAPVTAAAPQTSAKKVAAQTMIGTGIGPLSGAKPAAAPAQPAAAHAAVAAPAPEAKRNMAFAQTQHQAAFAAAPATQAATAPTPRAPAPADEPLGNAMTPIAPRPEPDPDPERPEYDAAYEGNYLPGDPMTPQAAAPPRAPMLRYDDSMPELPRQNPLQDKKLLWIAAGVIGFVCLGLVVLLFSKLMN